MMNISRRNMIRFANAVQNDVRELSQLNALDNQLRFVRFNDARIKFCGDGSTLPSIQSNKLSLSVLVGSNPAARANRYSEYDIAEYTLALTHEVFGHCIQFADLANGVGDDDFLFEMADHFVANQGPDKLSRYRFKYPYDVTETDANRKSLLTSLDLLKKYFPEQKYDVNWEKTILSIWKERAANKRTAFAPNAQGIDDIDTLSIDMICHTGKCRPGASNKTMHAFGFEYKPRDIYPTIPGDKVYEYLRTKASDEIVSLWKNAKSDWQRNVISCAIFAQEEPELVNTIAPNLNQNKRFLVRGVNIYDNVAEHQEAKYDRDASEIMNDADRRFLLRYLLDDGARFDARQITYKNTLCSIAITNNGLSINPLGATAAKKKYVCKDISDTRTCNQALTIISDRLVDIDSAHTDMWNDLRDCIINSRAGLDDEKSMITPCVIQMHGGVIDFEIN